MSGAPTTHTARVGDVELAYLELGDGSAGDLVILLHGFPDNAWTWDAQMHALADAGYRVVAPFLRGYPPSEVTGSESVPVLGSDLLGLSDELGAARTHVVGHDYGALAIYAALAREPERFASAAALAVSHPDQAVRVVEHPRLLHHAFHIWLLGHQALGEAAAQAGDLALIDYLWDHWSARPVSARHLEQVKRTTFASPDALDATLRYYRAMLGVEPGVEPGVPAMPSEPIETPMLAIYGREDPVAQALAGGEERFYTDYRRVDVAEAAHFVHRDAPETVSALLCEWVAEHA